MYVIYNIIIIVDVQNYLYDHHADLIKFNMHDKFLNATKYMYFFFLTTSKSFNCIWIH